MKTLVIHPADLTTDFLKEIYQGKDWTVINTNISKSSLRQHIKAHDRIIMLGHGTADGLLGFKHLVIDSTYVYLLREKYCIGIWCHAYMFFHRYNLKGRYTGMIISESEEALYYNVEATESEILESNKLFATAISKSLDSDDFVQSCERIYAVTNPLTAFNQKNIFCNLVNSSLVK